MYATCTIKSLTSSKMKMFIDYLIVQANVEFERVDALPGEKSSSGSNSGVTSGTENGHEWIDLGLTSGTRWATCNVGASKPQDYGNYFAFGETTTKETYNLSTYLDGQITRYPDYGTSKDALNGMTDIAGTQYDAATVNWGGKWRMPTRTQQDELRSQCYWVWTDNYNNSNVKGYIVYKAKSSSDKGTKIYSGETPSSSYTLSDAHIFLPAAGGRIDDNLTSGSYYWSSSLGTRDSFLPYNAWFVGFGSGYVGCDYTTDRYCGQSVRAVCK